MVGVSRVKWKWRKLRCPSELVGKIWASWTLPSVRSLNAENFLMKTNTHPFMLTVWIKEENFGRRGHETCILQESWNKDTHFAWKCFNIQSKRDSAAERPWLSKFHLPRDRTWEEQKAEHAFLKWAVQSQAQAYPLNQGLGSEGSALFWWTWNRSLSTLSSSQWSLFISNLQIMFLYLLSQCDNFLYSWF